MSAHTPRVKGLYYLSPEQFMSNCSSQQNCGLQNKDLLRRSQNITTASRISQVLNATAGGTPTFIVNSQSGGIITPLRNKF